MAISHTITENQYVAISQGGQIVGVGRIVEVTPRLYRVKASGRMAGGYKKSSLRHNNHIGFVLSFITPERAGQIPLEIEERENKEREKKYAEQEKKAKEAYDALPEARKLARSLKWLCEVTREEKIAEAPVEHLSALVEWAKANNLETE